MRGSWVSLVVGLVLVTAAAGPALAQSGDQHRSLGGTDTAVAASQPAFSPTYTFERLPDREDEIQVHASFDPPTTVTKVKLYLPEHAVVTAADGFSSSIEGNYTILTWDGQPAAPSVTYRVAATHRDGFGTDGYDAGEWAQFGTREVTPVHRWWYSGQEPRLDPTYQVADGEPGVATEFRTHLGPHEVVTDESSAGTVRLVVPEQSALAANRTAILATLQAGMSDLRIAPRKDDLTVFVAPEPIRRGGAAGSTGSYWVSAGSEPGTLDNTWIHEYVHERQAFETNEEMAWVVEGSAEYYAAYVSLRTGSVRYQRFRGHVTDTTYDQANLTAPETWVSADVEYRKGAYAVALIDARIQRATDGEQTFQQVMYWLNRHDGEVTWAVFADVVERVAGQNLDLFLERITAGTHDETVPDDPWLYTGSRIEDHDGDGLTNAEERAAGTHPFVADSDEDGLADGRERERGTDPTTADSDEDGLVDGREAQLGTEPTATDTDGDGLSDGREAQLGTDPLAVDTDGDGRDDASEVEAGTDPTAPPTEVEQTPQEESSEGSGLALVFGGLVAVAVVFHLVRG